MNVQEIKTKLTEATAEKNKEELTVEFVIDDKKFYINDMKAGTDTMEIHVTRKSYTPTPLNKFNNTLEHATSNLNVSVHNKDDNKDYKIDSLFCSEVFVEFTVQADS